MLLVDQGELAEQSLKPQGFFTLLVGAMQLSLNSIGRHYCDRT